MRNQYYCCIGNYVLNIRKKKIEKCEILIRAGITIHRIQLYKLLEK